MLSLSLSNVSFNKKIDIDNKLASLGMAEVGFKERSSWRNMVLRGRDSSPDSVVFTLESNLSLFSSASASVDRCSFASDTHDHDSLASEISLRLAGHEGDVGARDDSWSGPDPDPDPNKHAVRNKNKHSRFARKGEEQDKESQGQNEDSDADTEDEGNHLDLDSARNSFSLALKECKDKKARSESLLKKPDRRRPASLDLNSANGSSPRIRALNKSSLITRRSGIGTGTYTSPGTPTYRQVGVAMQKGWSSERVPLHANATRKQVGGAMLPFNNGRTLPSKWEDAERWILSPVSGDAVGRALVPPLQRMPKSKSGPLGTPGAAYYSLYSPAMVPYEGRNVGNFVAASPFSAGVISADALTIHSAGHDGVIPLRTEPSMARSASVHGCSEMQSQPSMPSREDRLDSFKDAGTSVSRAVSRRDMATQMSPQGSPCSSPNLRPAFSASTPPALSVKEWSSIASSKMDIRDVQVDEHVTVTRWSKKHKALFSGRGSETVESRQRKGMSPRSTAWDISETSKTVSKAKREEAKIIAWENLQKAKAEAAIRKLEMKLEKKRASSMDKIMNKLRMAQKKAEEMRSSVPPSEADQVVRTSHKAKPFTKISQMGSLSGCFICHAF